MPFIFDDLKYTDLILDLYGAYPQLDRPMKLHTKILEKLKNQASLSFAEFMQIALYDPFDGYYTMGIQNFGQDFTTAPELSPLFAACLANQCSEVLAKVKQPTILEFGAGSGRLCIDLLKQLEALNCLPKTYYILELSGRLRSLQEQAFAEEIPHLLSKIHWLDAWPSASFEGVILANEVLDAMPVHRFLQTADHLYEMYVSTTPDEQYCEVLQNCSEKLHEYVTQVLQISHYPYQSEVNLYLPEWLQDCAQYLACGMMLIIDYGFPRAEYYHPDRFQGTLMCHHRHRSHPNPFVHIGDQDITAHVDFTLVAESAVQAGFAVSGFTSQASFLLANGLLDLIKNEDNRIQFRHQQAVKQLTHPNEMGELFKVMALTKAWDDPLRGFQLQDRRASL